MTFLSARDGTRLSYSIEGDGPPLLLHLGAGCDAELWRAAGYLDPLSSSYRCILFDHRGHGRSGHPPGPVANHLDRYVEDVESLLDHLAIDSAAFWGYSNAIAVGLRLADRRAPRLCCLVGSGAIGKTPDLQLRALVDQSVANYRAYGWEKLIGGFEQQEGVVPDWMKERIRGTDIEPVIGWSEARPNWGWSSWDALSRVTIPTLFLVGEHEDPEDLMAEGVAVMSSGRRVRIPGAGHIKGFLDSTFGLPVVEEFLGRAVSSG